MALREDGLVEVSLSLSRRHVPLIPHIMNAVVEAYSSPYAWDSIKLCIDKDAAGRILLNMNKSLKPDSEVIVGQLHRCGDLVCRHKSRADDLVGDVRITSHVDRTLRQHMNLRHEENDDAESEAGGWVSDEMFFPSWYDRLRMQTDQGVLPFRRRDSVSSSPAPAENSERSDKPSVPVEENSDLFPFKPPKNDYEKESSRVRKVLDRMKTSFSNSSSRHRLQQPTDCSYGNTDTKRNIRSLLKRFDRRQEASSHNYMFTANYLKYCQDQPQFPLFVTVPTENVAYNDLNSSSVGKYNPIILPDKCPQNNIDSSPDAAEKAMSKNKGVLRSFSASIITKPFELDAAGRSLRGSDKSMNGTLNDSGRGSDGGGALCEESTGKRVGSRHVFKCPAPRTTAAAQLHHSARDVHVACLPCGQGDKQQLVTQTAICQHDRKTRFKNKSRGQCAQDRVCTQVQERTFLLSVDSKCSTTTADTELTRQLLKRRPRKNRRKESALKRDMKATKSSLNDSNRRTEPDDSPKWHEIEKGTCKNRIYQKPVGESQKMKRTKKTKSPLKESKPTSKTKMASENGRKSSAIRSGKVFRVIRVEDRDGNQSDREPRVATIKNKTSRGPDTTENKAFLLGKRVSLDKNPAAGDLAVRPSGKKDLSFVELLSLMTDEMKHIGWRRGKRTTDNR